MPDIFRRAARALNSGEDPEMADVRQFQEKFGQLSFHTPFFLTRRKQLERAAFMDEELKEFVNSSTLADQADALVDLVYVAKGTAVMMGLPWEELWAKVQEKNMQKVPGLTHRGNLVDVTKPEGWTPPDHGPILARAGWGFGDHPWNEFVDEALRDDDANRGGAVKSMFKTDKKDGWPVEE